MAIRESFDGTDGTYETYRGPSSYTSHKSYRSYQTDGVTQTVSRRESWGELIGELANQSVGLMRDEVALARRELEQKLKTVQSAAAVVVIGAITALIAALSICAAIIIALAEYVGPWQSALIVGLILGMAAGAAIIIGINMFKRTSLKPEQTIETFEENREWLKEMT
ncbi:MAG TPA: phage holin family protein [Blastocatellia bacterium]